MLTREGIPQHLGILACLAVVGGISLLGILQGKRHRPPALLPTSFANAEPLTPIANDAMSFRTAIQTVGWHPAMPEVLAEATSMAPPTAGEEWQSLVGRTVVVEGVAWTGPLGDSSKVLLQDQSLAVRNLEFADEQVSGRLVRLIGVLKLDEDVADASTASLADCRLEVSDWLLLECVSQPWIEEVR